MTSSCALGFLFHVADILEERLKSNCSKTLRWKLQDLLQTSNKKYQNVTFAIFHLPNNH